jgi:hypothetical protein
MLAQRSHPAAQRSTRISGCRSSHGQTTDNPSSAHSPHGNSQAQSSMLKRACPNPIRTRLSVASNSLRAKARTHVRWTHAQPAVRLKAPSFSRRLL